MRNSIRISHWPLDKLTDEEFENKVKRVLSNRIPPKARLEHFRRKLQESRSLNSRRQ